MRIYLCPALLDWLVFLVYFAVTFGAGQHHMSNTQIAWLGLIFQLAYLGSSVAAGYILKRDNARAILLGSTVACLGLSTGCVLLSSFIPLLVLMALYAVAVAAFFNAFQTFMRSEAEPGRLIRSVGLYTLAWSVGSGFGFLSAGTFYNLGRYALVAVCVVVCGIIITVLLRHRSRPGDAPSADEHVEQGSPRARIVDSRYVWIAWIIIFTAMFVQRPLQTFFPSDAAKHGISSFAASLPLALLMFIQGATGLYLIRHRDWLYRRTPLWIAHIAAAVMFLACWFWPSYWLSMGCISLSGVYAGFAFVSAVYYPSNSGNRTRNIGINEALVGVGASAGIFLSQMWIDHAGGQTRMMYLLCAIALVVSTILQMLVATVRRGPVRLVGDAAVAAGRSDTIQPRA